MGKEWGGCPAPSPPSGYPRPRARRGSTVIPAKAGIHPRPHLPPLGTRVRGHDDAPPSFLRKQESIPGTRERPRRPTSPLWVPASAGTTWFHRHSCESRNPSLSHLPPLGTRVRGHDVVPPSFLRSLSSWKRGAGIHRWDAGEAPPHLPPTPHRHSCESRNPSLGQPPPSGYPRPRARRGSTVIPAKAGIHPWDAGEAPPHLPPLGTRVRGHDVVPPSFLRKQESIPGTRARRGVNIHRHTGLPKTDCTSQSNQPSMSASTS